MKFFTEAAHMFPFSGAIKAIGWLQIKKHMVRLQEQVKQAASGNRLTIL
jgi:hypothetical protein